MGAVTLPRLDHLKGVCWGAENCLIIGPQVAQNSEDQLNQLAGLLESVSAIFSTKIEVTTRIYRRQRYPIYSMLGDHGLNVLSPRLLSSKTLTQINLNECDISDAGAQSLAMVLNGLPSLTELFLNKNRIGLPGIKALMNALLTNGTLKTLHLNTQNPPLSDAAARPISAMLLANSTLTSIDLSDHAFRERGFSAIAFAVGANTGLVHCDIFSNRRLSSRNITELKEMSLTNSTLRYFKIKQIKLISNFLQRNDFNFAQRQVTLLQLLLPLSKLPVIEESSTHF